MKLLNFNILSTSALLMLLVANQSHVVSSFTMPSTAMKTFTVQKAAVTNPTSSTSNGPSTSLSMAVGLPGPILKAAQKLPGGPTTAAAIAATALVGTAGVKFILDKPSRKYEDGSVAREYDAWTQDGILEYYWGEHIHLGYYNEEE